MKAVNYKMMLDYCDGPLLFEAQDVIGGQFLAMAVETAKGEDGYVVVGVAPEHLRQFRAGLVDLKSLVEKAGEEEWYLTDATDLSGPLILKLQREPLAQSGFLPDNGFVLNDMP